jgi:serine/threonine-protein kinase
VSSGRRYRIIAPIGRGGFGTVYRAELLGVSGFSRQVALKVLNPDIGEQLEVVQRFRDEARILGLVRHRAIVHVDGLTCLDGRWTVVMEYVEGVDLRAILARGPLPAGPALEIAAEVAGAIHAAYTRRLPNGELLRLLHRDLKPANIQVTADGEVKILDFGISRADFAGQPSAIAGEVLVEAGAVVTVACDASFVRCVAR